MKPSGCLWWLVAAALAWFVIAWIVAILAVMFAIPEEW